MKLRDQSCSGIGWTVAEMETYAVIEDALERREFTVDVRRRIPKELTADVLVALRNALDRRHDTTSE